MEWEAPAIILDARPYGEADALATVMTEIHGAHRGLARGAQSRTRAALWQPGNLIQVRWIGRLSDQLGSFSAELIHPAAALVLDDALALTMLTASCAVAEGGLPERHPYPAAFDGLLHLLARLPQPERQMAELIRWELALLRDLGYGLDLTTCAISGESGLGNSGKLAYVSPRTGRAVSEEAAGTWKDRLLPLPPFLIEGGEGSPPEWADGLRLTAHFLARDVFGLQHKPLPQARIALYDRVTALKDQSPDAR
ncbi:MAG: DNA repair protein RecO [Alphaproteobacteria bacterium]|nr:DNA repair protein RecO [Alphaproteobacteria bacterium]